MNKLIWGDALQALDKMIDAGVKVDTIITDPPYETIKGGSGKTLHKYRPSGVLFENNNFGWKIDWKHFTQND